MAEVKPKTAVQITRRGVVVWALLILFIAGWMFVLGIMVGRGTAPVSLDTDRLQQELAELKAALEEKEQAEIEAQASGQTDPQTKLGFYEALKETRQPSTYSVPRTPQKAAARPQPNPAERLPIENRPAAASPAASGQAPPAAVKPPAAPQKTNGPEKRDDNPSSPDTHSAVTVNTPVVPPRPESKAPADSGGGAFTIQVAAFKETASAQKVVDQLRNQGYPAYQIRSESDGQGVWYRVRVGAFKDRAAAQGMLKKLDAAKIRGIVIATP